MNVANYILAMIVVVCVAMAVFYLIPPSPKPHKRPHRPRRYKKK